MKVEELVFFPTQLVHVETIRFNAEKKLEKAGMKYRIKAETRGEVVDEKMGKSYIKYVWKIMVTILRKKKLVFSILRKNYR